jgi:hypothetical protein
MKGIITAGQSVQFTGNYLPCNISLIDVWFLVICRLYSNLHCRELRPAMCSNGPLAQVVLEGSSPYKFKLQVVVCIVMGIVIFQTQLGPNPPYRSGLPRAIFKKSI